MPVAAALAEEKKAVREGEELEEVAPKEEDSCDFGCCCCCCCCCCCWAELKEDGAEEGGREGRTGDATAPPAPLAPPYVDHSLGRAF
jgi:hypothetical protein